MRVNSSFAFQGISDPSTNEAGYVLLLAMANEVAAKLSVKMVIQVHRARLTRK